MERVTFTNGAERLNIHMENKNELPPYVTPTYMYFYALCQNEHHMGQNPKYKAETAIRPTVRKGFLDLTF